MPTVLSVQSRVAYGHVGNAASVFPLQRLGIEAWALDTVAFSNHTGHGQWRGAAVPAAVIAELFEGIAALGVLPHIDAVLSGYLGDATTGPPVRYSSSNWLGVAISASASAWSRKNSAIPSVT